MVRILRASFLVACCFSLGGCEVLQALLSASKQAAKAEAPTVTYQKAELVESPSQKQMEAYYCPVVVPDPLGVTGGARALCEQAFGGQPSQDRLHVSFDLKFLVKNPNHFPIPVAELLTAATVFPDKTSGALGAACITFCASDDPSCTGKPGVDSCRSKKSDIRSLDDFGNRSADLLLAAGASALSGEKPSFKIPQVVQDAELVVTARFTFGADPLLNTLKQLAVQSVDQLKDGKSVTFEIPYKLEGTVWFDVGSAGRVEVGFGPQTGSWIVPTESLTLP